MSDKITENFDDFYQTAPCAFLSLTPDSKVFQANQTLGAWLGRAPGEMVGMRFQDLLSFGGRIAYETHLSPLLRMQDHVHEIALDFLAADGSKVPMFGNASEKRGTEGNHISTRFALFKAVDRRAYERGLLKANVEVKAALEKEHETSLLREQFIAVLGHDLRNPFASLSAGLRLLAKNVESNDRNEKIIGEMRGSIRRGLSLIDDVLDLARGRLGGGIGIEPQIASPEPALRQVIAEVRSFAREHEIIERLEIDRPVNCDPDRLAQLAANLLSNAVSHGATAKPVIIEASTTGEQFRLSVANSGEPIPDKLRDHLFSPFFRAAGRSSQNGLGLGLYIASEVAKAHGGTLEVVSDEIETRFTFTMPTASDMSELR